jgi:hypothetical protein
MPTSFSALVLLQVTVLFITFQHTLAFKKPGYTVANGMAGSGALVPGT